MIDKEIVCNGPREMIEAAHQTIYESLGKLKYVNLKYKCAGAAESAWLYNVDFAAEGEDCVITFLNADAEPIVVALGSLEYFKLRPVLHRCLCRPSRTSSFTATERKENSNELKRQRFSHPA